MKVASRPAPTVLGCVLLLVGFVPPTDPELASAEKQLRDHSIGTDGPSLLRYFAQRTLTPADRSRLALRIRDLGDENFEVRQEASAHLIRTGSPALPALRTALKDADLERALRAERCIDAIEAENREQLTEAAVRVLVARRPPEAVAALLAYLPDCADDSTRWAVHQALLALAQRDGKVDPVLMAALTDKEPARRGAAAYALGRTTPTETSRLRPLLEDTDPQVRFEAASALIRAGNRDAVPVLIGLLADAPTPLAWQVHDVLLNLAGEKPPSAFLPDDPAARRSVRTAWLDWWQANGAHVDLARSGADGMRQQGVNILLEIRIDEKTPETSCKVWECRADGKERWSLTSCQLPVDVQILPGSRLLVAEYLLKQVTERDRTGKVLWTYTASSRPTTCQRLPNGNTFIATDESLLEIGPDGKPVTSFANPVKGKIFRARRLPNGHTLFLSEGGKIVELNRIGEKVRIIDVGFPETEWGGVEPLPDGRFLVCLYSQNRVFEVDAAGQRSHEITVRQPASAMHLANGHTLVASAEACQALEFDAAGRVVWQQKTTGRLLCVRRY